MSFCHRALALFLLLPSLAVAQQPPTPSLRFLVGNAGYIFAGTVQRVERIDLSDPNGVPTIQVTFHVDRAMRGVRTGQMLTIREWARLWDAGERYRVGEHMVLFLYRPSKLGLTSPVNGPYGRFQTNPDGSLPLDRGRLAGLQMAGIGEVQRRRGPAEVVISPRALSRAVRRAVEE